MENITSAVWVLTVIMILMATTTSIALRRIQWEMVAVAMAFLLICFFLKR